MPLPSLAALTLLADLAASAAPTVAMNGHLPSASDCAAMAALGARAVRMDFNWFQFEPAQDQFDFSLLDQAVDAAAANGLGVYATVAYTPQWAASDPSCVQCSPDELARCEPLLPANDADWVDAVTAVASHFAGRIECWGIWNEPNLRSFFAGTEDDFVDRIFVPAAQAIRAADPGARICGPELSGLTASSTWNGKNGTCIFGNCIRNGWEIDLAHMLDRLGPYLDVITHHTYKADAAAVMQQVLDGEWTAGVLTHDAIRNVIDAHGGASKEFWLTETGWEHGPQGSLTEAEVASRIVDLYARQEEVCAGTYAASANDPWPEWTRTYYYHFPYDPGSGWGLLDSSGNGLEPYTALQAWASGRTTTACVGPAGPPDAGAGPDAAAAPGPDAASAEPGDAGEPDPDAAGGGEDAGWAPGADATAPTGGADAQAPPPPHADAGLAELADARVPGQPGADADPFAGPDGATATCGCAAGAPGAAPFLLVLLLAALAGRLAAPAARRARRSMQPRR